MNKIFAYFQSYLLIFIFISSCSGQDKSKASQVGADSKEDLYMKLHVDTTIKDTSKYIRTPLFVQIHSNLGGLVNEFVRIMYQDTKGDYWFGTNGDGLLHYDGDSITQYQLNKKANGTAVRGIVEDKSGNVWIGHSGGLSKYNGHSFINYSTEDGLIGNELWGLEIDNKGLLWIGTEKGVSTFDGETFNDFPIPQAEIANPQPLLSHERVGMIMEDSKGNIWFATDGYGICIYDGKNFIHLTKEDGLPDNNIADIFEDRQGNIWIGTYYGGLSRYDPSIELRELPSAKTSTDVNRFTNYTKDGIIEGIEAFAFTEDMDGNIWFSVENVGVYRYDPSTDSFAKFSRDDGLATDGILSILADNKGQIWLGTWQGLSLYDGKSISNVSDKVPWTK